MSGRLHILLAEDDESDVFLLRRAFQDAGETVRVDVASDGQMAIEMMERARAAANGELPAMIILDLKMPRRTGMDVLEWLRRQDVLRCIPAVIFSSSSRDEDCERAYALGANAYLLKPSSTRDRVQIARFLGEWLKLSRPPLAAAAGFLAAQSAHVSYGFVK